MSISRRVAVDILKAVEGGEHSDELLLQRTLTMDSRDAGLTWELVFGVLRHLSQIDFLIAHFGAPPQLGIDVRMSLRLGVFQLRYLDRIPRHAAVSESVELVKWAGRPQAAGLVNAVLRKVHRDPVTWPDESFEYSMPAWLFFKWKRELGADAARQAAAQSLTVPAKGMDPGAKSIVPLLELESHHSLLDLCAAPGNKLTQACEIVTDYVACDRSFRRLRQMGGRRVLLDATEPLPFRDKFDRILLDAPCSGTGTLARNPEIKWRATADDLIRQQTRQKRMLAEALKFLKPGGRLVYATCSLEREENEDVVAGTAGLIRMIRRTPGIDEGDGFFAAQIEGI